MALGSSLGPVDILTLGGGADHSGGCCCLGTLDIHLTFGVNAGPGLQHRLSVMDPDMVLNSYWVWISPLPHWQYIPETPT